MRYVGLDIHKSFCQASVLNENGKELSNTKFPTTVEGIQRFLTRFDDAKFVLESTGVWEFVYENVESKGFPVILAHPMKVKAIASAKIKTDKVDARTLAQLLRLDMVPASYVPDKETRNLRELVRHRSALVKKSTAFKNRIHAELLRRGLKQPDSFQDIFTKKGRTWLRSLDVIAITSNVVCLETIRDQVHYLDGVIVKEHDRRDDAQILTTIPGIGPYSALVIVAEIDDVHRFPDPEHLCSYAGLVPTVRQSANTCHYGHLSRQGSKHLRWILTEAVHAHVRCEPSSQLSVFMRKIEKRRGKQRATMATCRKMLKVIYWMLLKKEPYHSHGFNPVNPPA